VDLFHLSYTLRRPKKPRPSYGWVFGFWCLDYPHAMLLDIMNRTTSIRWLRAITYVGVYGGLLMPLAFFPVVIFPFVFSKLLFFQTLIGLTFPAYLVLLWVDPQSRPRWAPLYGAIIAYFLAVTLSVIFAVDPLRAWWGNQERMNGLFTLLHFVAWLSMTVSLLKTWKQWKKILLFEICISALMAIVALLQKPYPTLLRFPAGDRVGGLLDNPIYMAAYQIFNLSFILLIWLKGVARSTKGLLIICALLDISAFIAAQSRGALVGLAAGVVVFAVAYALMTPHKKTKFVVLSFAALLFIAYGLMFTFRDTALIRGSGLYRLTDIKGTTKTRLIAWDIAWQGFLERPLTGWGFDNFHILFNEKYHPESLRYGYYETWFDRAHNTVLDALSMTGIIGSVTFFSIFGTLFYSVYRAYRKKWIDPEIASIFCALPIAYFVQNIFVFDQPAGFSMSFFMYALIIRATTSDFMQPRAEDGTSAHKLAATTPSTTAVQLRAVPWTALAGLYALFFLIIWRTSVLPARASYNAIAANNYFSAGLYREAFALTKRAASFPTPYTDEQTFLNSRNLIALLQNGKLDQLPEWKDWYQLSKDITLRHLSEHPRNTHPHFIYANLLHSFVTTMPQDISTAEQEYLAAIKTSPKRQQLYFGLGRFYLEHDKKQAAYELFRQAAEFDQEVGESRWFLGLVLMFELNRNADGARELSAAVKTLSPYQLKNIRDVATLATAYEILKDPIGYKQLLPRVDEFSGSELGIQLEIARIAERMGLMQERDHVLQTISKSNSDAAQRLAPLLVTHTATSIDASFKQTASLVVPATPPPAKLQPKADSNPPPRVATTSRPVGGGGGPRVRR